MNTNGSDEGVESNFSKVFGECSSKLDAVEKFVAGRDLLMIYGWEMKCCPHNFRLLMNSISEFYEDTISK